MSFAYPLGDLHAVQRRALAHVVGNHPQIQAALAGEVLAHPANVYRIVADGVVHGRGTTLAVFDERHALGLAQQIAGVQGRDRIAGFDMQRFRMAVEHRDAHAGGVHPNAVVLKDLLRLARHFHLFFGVAVGADVPSVGYGIEGDLRRMDRAIVERLGVQQIGGLAGQFGDAGGAGAGDRLIGGDVDALDARRIVNGLERHRHLNGRTVGIGDDVGADAVGDALVVHLGNHQRDAVVHAELGSVVDHHGTGLGGARRVLAGDRPAGGEQGDLRVGEIEVVQRLHGNELVAHLQALAGGAFARQERHGVVGEAPLVEDFAHRFAHRAGGADDGDIRLFHVSSRSLS